MARRLMGTGGLRISVSPLSVHVQLDAEALLLGPPPPSPSSIMGTVGEPNSSSGVVPMSLLDLDDDGTLDFVQENNYRFEMVFSPLDTESTYLGGSLLSEYDFDGDNQLDYIFTEKGSTNYISEEDKIFIYNFCTVINSEL